MTVTFKAVHGFYVMLTSLHFNFSHPRFTRGNKFKIEKKHVHYNTNKFFFRNRVISAWNS
jgi:hypothetical protein